jgi:hypothetical protein
MPRVNADDTALTRKRVTISLLEVEGKPMTASVFRQLPKRPLVNRRGMRLNGEPVGRVNYFWGSCNSMHLHIVWIDSDGDLARDCVYPTRAKNEPPDHEWTETYIQLQRLPQLYIEGTEGSERDTTSRER